LNSVAFIARVAPGGAKLVWGTYVPLSSAPNLTAPSILGVPVDTISALALDSSGSVVFAGVAAAGFPISSGALQSAFPSGPAGAGITYAGYVAKLNSNGSSLVFSTWFGSAGQLANQNAPASVALDSAGNIWITGTTFSPSSLPAPAGTPLLGNSYIAGLTPGGALVSLTLVPNGGSGNSGPLYRNGGHPGFFGSAADIVGRRRPIAAGNCRVAFIQHSQGCRAA
jgi:hypothetical protein